MKSRKILDGKSSTTGWQFFAPMAGQPGSLSSKKSPGNPLNRAAWGKGRTRRLVGLEEQEYCKKRHSVPGNMRKRADHAIFGFQINHRKYEAVDKNGGNIKKYKPCVSGGNMTRRKGKR